MIFHYSACARACRIHSNAFFEKRELFFISLFFWLIVALSTFSESLLGLYFTWKSFIFRSFESFDQCLNSFPISKNSAFFSFPNCISFVRHIAIFLNKTQPLTIGLLPKNANKKRTWQYAKSSFPKEMKTPYLTSMPTRISEKLWNYLML